MEQILHDVFISYSFRDQIIANKIVTYLTEKHNVSCWICTDEIRAGENFRKKLAQAILATRVVVFIQSKQSAVSEEVAKEIFFASQSKKKIIPFVIEDSTLDPSLSMELGSILYIDATNSQLLNKNIDELAKEIISTLGNEMNPNEMHILSQHEHLVSTPSVIPKQIFMGREGVLNEIHDRFSHGERIVFLSGIGGIGKTQIAQQYIKRYKNDYETIIYSIYTGSIKELILSEKNFIIAPEMIKYRLPDGTIEDNDSFYQRKLEKIIKLSNEKTIVVVDNYDEEDERFLDLVEGKYKLLVTTRCDYSRFYPTITIDTIESTECLKDIFQANYRGYDLDLNSPDFLKLINIVNRHTYAIELLAQHMENSGQTISQMIEALQEKGIWALNEEVKDYRMKADIAYMNLLRIFRIAALNDDQKRILMNLTLTPHEGVEINTFKRWSGLASSRIINNLENKGWIIRNKEGLSLHPIIRDVINHETPVTKENCSDFLQCFIETIEERKTWHMKKVEKDKHAFVARKLLHLYEEINPETEELYSRAEMLFSFSVDPEYAISLATRIYEHHKHNMSFPAARAAFRVGWGYAYNTHLPNSYSKALAWLQTAHNLFSRIELRTDDEIVKYSQTLVNLAKTCSAIFERSNDYSVYINAKAYATEALQLVKSSFGKECADYSKVAGAYCQLADVLHAGKEYSSALECMEKALETYNFLGTNDANSMYFLYRKAIIMYALNRLPEATLTIKQAVGGYAEFFGNSNPLVVDMYSLMADCLFAGGNSLEAAITYEKALSLAKVIYTPNAIQISEIEAKLKNVYEENAK